MRMNAPQACPPPTRALRRLADFLHESGSKLSAVDAATMAINQWIAMERGQLTSVVATPTRGYQWKTLFLPEGSELRISFERENFYGNQKIFGRLDCANESALSRRFPAR